MTEVEIKSLEEALMSGVRAKDELCAVTAEMNLTIEKIGRLIAGLRLGVPAEVDLELPGDGRLKKLRYTKIDSMWQLAYVTGKPSDEHVEPLVSSPRSIRMVAMRHLNRLLLEMVEGARHEAGRVRASIAIGQQFADFLTPHLAKSEGSEDK